MMNISHRFVKNIPDHLEEGIIYVSIEYATAIHKCFCGCGNEVVTPFSPRDWKLTFDGETITLNPSIGNWSFPCMSHYWITNNKVKWAPRWTWDKVENGKNEHKKTREEFSGIKKKRRFSIFDFLF